jgi:hypothetical protein
VQFENRTIQIAFYRVLAMLTPETTEYNRQELLERITKLYFDAYSDGSSDSNSIDTE